MIEKKYSIPFDFTLDHLASKENGIVHPMHENWKDEMINSFKIRNDQGEFLPIIPDLNIILDGVVEVGDEKYKYTYPEKPKYNPEALFKLEGNIEKRINYIIDKLFEKDSTPQEEGSNETDNIADEWLKIKFRKSWWQKLKGKIGSGIFKLVKKPSKKMASSSASKMVIKMILKDLEEKEVLAKPKK